MDNDFDRERVAHAAERSENPKRFKRAIQRFDDLNNQDPNRVIQGGGEFGYELFFSRALFARTLDLAPAASEALLLAARSQHLCRWKSPRSDYPMDRSGYLRWRADLKRYHAATAAEVLQQIGYEDEMIERVRSLNLKKDLRTDSECQTLEDALCLVFLERQFAEFSERTDPDKMVSILRKTWAKMSEQGQAAAVALPMAEEPARLVQKALEGQ